MTTVIMIGVGVASFLAGASLIRGLTDQPEEIVLPDDEEEQDDDDVYVIPVDDGSIRFPSA